VPLQFTRVLRDELTPDLERRIERAYYEFPELKQKHVRVGLTNKRWLDGYADGEDFCIRLNVRRRNGVSYFTIGHELTHLLQKPGLGTVPEGEVQCDIWTLARSKLFLDEMPGYLDVHPVTEKDWARHAARVHRLCRRALEVRQSNRRYIVWFRESLQHHFSGPVQLGLFAGGQVEDGSESGLSRANSW
jgi:hypothetical protein